MAWWVPLIMAGASLAGSMLNKQEQPEGIRPFGANDSPLALGTQLALNYYMQKATDRAAEERAPEDFRVKMFGQDLPVNLASARKKQKLSEGVLASQMMGYGLGGMRGYAPPVQAPQNNAMGGLTSLLPLMSLFGQGNSNATSQVNLGGIQPYIDSQGWNYGWSSY